MPSGLHSHSHVDSPLITVKLLRLSVVMAQLPFVVLSCFCLHKRDLLHPRVIIASYNPHVGSFLPSLGLVSAPSLRGASSRHCYEITLIFGQERSKVKTALTAGPCRAPHCSYTTQRSSSSLKEFQGPYNHPEGVDGANMSAPWRTPTPSSARTSRTIAFSKNSAEVGWVRCIMLKIRNCTETWRWTHRLWHGFEGKLRRRPH